MRPTSFVVPAALLLASVPAPAAAQPQPEIGIEVRLDVSPSLRDVPPVAAEPGPDREVPNQRYDRPFRRVPPAADPLLDSSQALGPALQSTPNPSRNLEGMSADDNFALLAMRFAPADPVGDVGPSHYVQAVNLLLKTTGARIFGPVPLKTLWSGFGGLCETENDGDPIVLYDDAADRWVISQFALNSSFNGHQCIAVSTSGDPTGSYHRYDFLVTPTFLNDYPKIGVWPDGYYMSINEFDDLGAFYGVTVVAFERAPMLTGASAQMVKFHPYPCGLWNPPVPECPFSLQPAHWEGGTPPPAGAPNPFLMAWDDEVNGAGTNPDGYRLYDFAVNWASPASSTFTARPHVTSPEFDRQLWSVPQPSPGEGLDALADYTMYRLQYRNFGSHAGHQPSALRAGDNNQDRQYRTILSFDTVAIPDGAAVQSVTLRVRRGSLTGTSPFSTHGSLVADVRTGGFNGNAALENADFQAAATATAVCTLSNAAANGDWSECALAAAGLAAVNKTGKTQFRLRRTLDDNDDNGNDYLGYYSGNNGTAANHPQLVVTYQ